MIPMPYLTQRSGKPLQFNAAVPEVTIQVSSEFRLTPVPTYVSRDPLHET